jgi:CxxC motif-containing protein (DUF1111 family)
MQQRTWLPLTTGLVLLACALSAGALFGGSGGSDQFERGRAIFKHPFHKSDGLGLPEMNADSCRACHRDPVMGGSGNLEFNVSRFGRITDGVFENMPGGQGLSKLRAPWVDRREEHDLEANVFEQRQTPALFGTGLIDAIPEAEILRREDPTDRDHDGIRGVARHLRVGGRRMIGRFGWKAQIPTLRDFAKDALGNECGITTPDDFRGFAITDDADGVPDAEFNEEQVDDLVFFMAELSPPARVGSEDPRVAQGEALFESLGCVKCHVPTLFSDLGPANLYSDLLLHNVMPGGFRGMAEEGADMGFFRTPPLWGIRETAPYMHDGRAEDLDKAIRAHHGEARAIKKAYRRLPAVQRQALILFLQDL